MSSNTYQLLAVAVCALCTFLLRLAPFALFRRGMPPFLRDLAAKLPAAIIAVLVVYCLKGLPAGSFSSGLIPLVSVAFVVLLHLWRKNTLLSIAMGTALYMLLLRLI